MLRCVVYYKSLGFAASWTRSLQPSWYCPHLRTTHFIHFQYKPIEVMYLTEHEAYLSLRNEHSKCFIFTTDYTLQSQQHVFIWTVSIRAFVFSVFISFADSAKSQERLRNSNFWVYILSSSLPRWWWAPCCWNLCDFCSPCPWVSPLKKHKKDPWQNNDIVATSCCVFFFKSYIGFLGLRHLYIWQYFS